MRRGSVFLCDVSHSGAAQSGDGASWDTKIGFVLLSPWSVLTYSVLLPLVSGVCDGKTNTFAVCASVRVIPYTCLCVLCKKRKIQTSFSSLLVSLINCYIPAESHLRHSDRTYDSECLWTLGENPTKSPHMLYIHTFNLPHRPTPIFLTQSLHLPNPPIFCNLLHIFHVCNVFFFFPN